MPVGLTPKRVREIGRKPSPKGVAITKIINYLKRDLIEEVNAMEQLDKLLRLIELEAKMYKTVDNIIVNAIKEKYKVTDLSKISYKVLDSKPKKKPTNTCCTSREERLKYMRECQKNWDKGMERVKNPNGGK